MKYTNEMKIKGELAVRNLSDKAQKLYNEIDPMAVYAYGGMYAFDSCMGSAEDLTLEQLESAFEDMYNDLNESVYYWLETDASDGCNHWDWALVRGMYDMDGKKDRDTEERIVFGTCDDGDISECWNTIDSMIRQTLGFVPDYEVN